jgi:hypothetical protein
MDTAEAINLTMKLSRCKRKFDPRKPLRLGKPEMYCQLYCFGDEQRGIPCFNQTKAYEGAYGQVRGARQNASRLHQRDDIRLRIEWLLAVGSTKTPQEAVAAGARLALVTPICGVTHGSRPRSFKQCWDCAGLVGGIKH